MEDINIVNRNLARFKLLEDKILNNWDDYEFFLDYLFENYKNYFKIITSFEGYIQKKLIENKDITICLFEKLTQTIADYLKGRVTSAYQDMGDAFSCISDVLKRKSSNRIALPAEFGFKASIIKNDEPVPSRERMFHIPFELRHLVQNHRYSIHGIPSVYLGKSIYDCYIELGSPPLEDFWVSLFIFSQNTKNVLSSEHINLIDLTLSNHDIGTLIYYVKKDQKSLTAAQDHLVDDILLWPLILACSIPCKYPKAAFKQEYIIPQIIYQLCSDYNEYVGIKYYSTKAKNVNKNIYRNTMTNYALPAYDVRKSGYCPKLASQLMLTAPIAASHITDIKIETDNNISTHGFPILSNMHESLKKDETILFLDKMTIYFDNLMNTFMNEKNMELIKPLYGWLEESD